MYHSHNVMINNKKKLRAETVIDERLSRELREKIAGDDIEMRHVARMTKISKTTLYRILYDDSCDPKYSSIKRLCSYLKINIDQFIHDLNKT